MRYAIALALLFLFAGACGSSDDALPSPAPSTPVPVPWLRVIPSDDGRIGGAPLYIALGDSLSAGVGASNYVEKGFVGLVHDKLGPEFALLNLGIAGDTSRELIEEGPLDRVIAEIEQRNYDDNADNNVTVVTLEIGGNDLLELFLALALP